jgi:hypothetical protein
MTECTGPKRKPAEREADLLETAQRYARGESYREIAAVINSHRTYQLSHQTISKDVVEILKRWRATAAAEISEAKAAELLRINQLEREAWMAWERSKEDAQRRKSVRTGGDTPDRVELNVEGQCGDPRYLQQVQWCIERRCKLLGLDAPTKQEVGGLGGGPIVIELPDGLNLTEG